MNRKSITVYSVVISAVFAAAVFFFCYSLFHEYSSGAERTGREFDSFVHSASSSLISSGGSESGFSAYCSSLVSPEEYVYASVRSSSADLFDYPSAREASAGTSSRFCREYRSTFTSGSETYTITAGLYLLRPSSIFYWARFSFLIILAATVFTVVLILYLRLSGTPAESVNVIPDEAFADEVHAEPTGDLFSDENEPAPDETVPSEEKIVHENEKKEDSSAAYELAPAEDMPAEKETPSSSEPQGLFSPSTGFGWEQYLETRLDSELVRAASSEQDLSVFLIRLPGMKFTDEFSSKICSYLLEQFQFKDMLFEYKNDGFAVIQDNTPVDEAVKAGDALRTGIMKILSSAGSSLQCFIGISSRSVRMLPGNRLIHEADEALEHAMKEEDSPIVAFRANADKYRKFIESKM
jgi:GGDEF domain-containing protein